MQKDGMERVSIPERVLEALKPQILLGLLSLFSVSIPERVLEALKHLKPLVFQ